MLLFYQHTDEGQFQSLKKSTIMCRYLPIGFLYGIYKAYKNDFVYPTLQNATLSLFKAIPLNERDIKPTKVL